MSIWDSGRKIVTMLCMMLVGSMLTACGSEEVSPTSIDNVSIQTSEKNTMNFESCDTAAGFYAESAEGEMPYVEFNTEEYNYIKENGFSIRFCKSPYLRQWIILL